MSAPLPEGGNHAVLVVHEAGGNGSADGHRAWCSPSECYYSEGTLVHQQVLHPVGG